MGTKHNRKKSKQLGMPHGTAAHKLRKQIMFSLIQETGRDKCYRCDKTIASVDDLSIDHIEPWLDSSNPIGLFFDLKNIAFSHLSCNCANSRGLTSDPEKGIVYREKNTRRPWVAYSSVWGDSNYSIKNKYIGAFATRGEAVRARKKDLEKSARESKAG